MQRIVRNQKNLHPIFNDIENLYYYTSEKSSQKTIVPLLLDKSFDYLTEVFEVYGGVECDVCFTDKQYSPIAVNDSNDTDILVAFSSGKDSTACALYYKECGYNVTLYHLRGINQTYKDEWQVCQEVAKKLDMPLVIETVSLSGSHKWIEHPMKNMIIANHMIQYCLRNNQYPLIAFGNFNDSKLASEPFDVCGGDCVEMWEIYEDIMDAVIPGFSVQVPFDTMTDTWKILLPHREVLDVVQSCIGPYRYREYLKSHNEDKYGIKLLNHHCGSCWKCCLEYCVYADNDIMPYNREYYKHCLEILRKTHSKETKSPKKLSMEAIWKYYFFYDMKESKFFKDEN